MASRGDLRDLLHRRHGQGRHRHGAADRGNGRAGHTDLAANGSEPPDRALLRHQCLAASGRPELWCACASFLSAGQRHHRRDLRRLISARRWRYAYDLGSTGSGPPSLCWLRLACPPASRAADTGTAAIA
ncbi:conserved hypothetical protein, partial [Ricinus communis]